MALSWGKRRKLLYTTVAGMIGVVVLLWGYNTFIARTPSCQDGIWNGNERGTDCGGSCLKICRNDAKDPVVLWARSFQTSPTTHTAAAYIENRNQGALARKVEYSFQLFDDKNILVVERTGTTNLPPVVATPIIETNIDVGNRPIFRTLFSFSSTPVWEKNTKTLPELKVGNQFLTNDGSRLSATLQNDTVNDVRNVVVVAVLFDASGVARAASRALIPKVVKRSSEQVVFTWPGGVEEVIRAEITLLPPL